MDDFEYVVARVIQAPICFGSKVVRNTDPIGKGLSAFQKRYAIEINPKTTPQTYKIKSGLEEMSHKVVSTRGVGGLATPTPRFPKPSRRKFYSPTRSVDTKPRQKKIIKIIEAPFGSKVLRASAELSTTPGPGYYDTRRPGCTRTKIVSNFGHPKMIPAVEEKCVPGPVDKCHLCGHFCDNDYWHINYTYYLCNYCMQEQKVMQEYFSIKELKKYKKIRICSIRHSHEGTTAAVWLLPKPKRDKRERLENYLSLYLSDF